MLFLQALVRFTNIYGIPNKIYSNNEHSFDMALGLNLIEYHAKLKEYDDKFLMFNIKHL